MAQGAELAGLNLDIAPGSELSQAVEDAICTADWPARTRKFSLIRTVGGTLRRSGPKLLDEINESARERCRRDPEYRPPGMYRFRGDV